jgi:hypothetical protein
LAAAQDNDYQSYSPYLNHSTAVSGVIEFEFDIPSEPHEIKRFSELATLKRFSFGWFTIRPSANWDSWKWALFERRRFERFVAEFQKWTAKIKDLVPLMMALNPHYDNSLVLDKLITNEHSRRVGVAPHASLRRLAIEPGLDQTNFFIENVKLDAPLEAECLTIANLVNTSDTHPEPEKVLVEYKRYGGDTDDADIESDHQTEERVHQLASLLSSAGTHGLHTLEFRGLINQSEGKRYAFLFNFPPPSSSDRVPTSLYSLMSRHTTLRMSLPQRFRVAKDAVTAVSAFHADGWVHKSIRSHSIVFFPTITYNSPSSPIQNEVTFGDCYLTDFEFARPETAQTQYTFDNHLEKILYRHPERQGPPTVSFRKIHDIYALGVVLLEVGVWQTALSIYQQAHKKLKPGVTMSPRGIQNLFIEIARRQLPHHMGPAYRDAVVKCLLGTGFGEEENWVMTFYEEVVQNIDVGKLQ